MSVEICELVLALLWRTVSPPALVEVHDRRCVAVLMTVCDDAHPAHLASLAPLASAGYRVFVLDDSCAPADIPRHVAASLTVVRRETRAGAKAGNINNWLRQYGDAFDLCILLDSDSLMSAAAADMLVRTADHPANAMTAIFQSALLPYSADSPTWLQRVLAVGAAVRNRIHARVHARLGVLLSFGHNQLLRLSMLREVGGMDERWSSEDTVLSLKLAASGYGIALVNARTYDSDPHSIEQYVRRTVRWARQTVEIFSCEWRPVPLRYKFVLCWHLLSYLMPLFATTLLLLSLWKSPATPGAVIDFSLAALRFEPGYQTYGIAMWPGIAAVLLRICIGTTIALIEGAGIKGRAAASLLGGSIQAFVLLPLAVGMLRSLLGNSVSFEPTNVRRARGSRRLLVLGYGGALGMFVTVVLGLALHPGGALVGMNGLWCLGLLGVPVVLVVSAIERLSLECSKTPRRGRPGPGNRGFFFP
jgi:hypothetical protein